jgi:hypothetical protein
LPLTIDGLGIFIHFSPIFLQIFPTDQPAKAKSSWHVKSCGFQRLKKGESSEYFDMPIGDRDNRA